MVKNQVSFVSRKRSDYALYRNHKPLTQCSSILIFAQISISALYLSLIYFFSMRSWFDFIFRLKIYVEKKINKSGNIIVTHQVCNCHPTRFQKMAHFSFRFPLDNFIWICTPQARYTRFKFISLQEIYYSLQISIQSSWIWRLFPISERAKHFDSKLIFFRRFKLKTFF